MPKRDNKIRPLDNLSLFAVFLSLAAYTLETSDDSSSFPWMTISIGTSVFFAAEYLIRLMILKDKRRYVFSFLGIVDLLSFLPLLLTFGHFDTRFLQVIRVIRLIKIAKIIRYESAFNRLINAFKKVKEELAIFTMMTLIALYLSAVGIYQFESAYQPEKFGSIAKCLWWAVSTLTTVGYGDVFPMTAGGKLFTGMVLIIGVGLVSVPSGLLAAALSQTKSVDDHSQHR